MKLNFTKNGEEGIVVDVISGDETFDFNYIELVNYLYAGKVLETSDYGDGITTDEKAIVNEMIKKINDTIQTELTEVQEEKDTAKTEK
jgi:hypothetical protein